MKNQQRDDRIKILRRQEDRNKRVPSLLTNLSVLVKRQFSENDVLTIEQIDQHQIQINGSDFDFNYLNLSFPIEKVIELVNIIDALKDKLSESNYFTLSTFSEIGVLKVKTDFVIKKLEDIIKLDKDSFTVHDEKYKNGLWVDLFQDYWYLDNKTQFIWIYELRVFGKEWIKLINEKL